MKPYRYSATQNTVEESLHSVIQGSLIEIVNIRGFHTFCPDKSKKFNDVELGKISTLTKCPELQFSNYDLLRKIDVIWFREIGFEKMENISFPKMLLRLKCQLELGQSLADFQH